MANETRLASSLLAVKEVDVTEGGNTYDKSAVDTNALRAFGGKYDVLPTYTDDDIARYTNAVVAENNTWDGLDASGWQEGAAGPTDGALPVTVHAIAIEYVAELGTVGFVRMRFVATGSIVMAILDLGEGVALPIPGGLTLANIEILADVYADGVNEATINLLILGV